MSCLGGRCCWSNVCSNDCCDEPWFVTVFAECPPAVPALFIPVLIPPASSLHRSLCHLLSLGSSCLPCPEVLPTAHLPVTVTVSCHWCSWKSHKPCLWVTPGHLESWVHSLLGFQLQHLGRWFSPNDLRCSATCPVGGLCSYHWEQCPCSL